MVTYLGSQQNATLLRNYFRNQADSGKLWLAVGTGLDSWDSQLPEANPATTKLQNEVCRVKIESSDIQLVDVSQTTSQDDVITDNSRTLRILGNVICPLKPLREYGLFFDGNSSKDTGTLHTYDIHSKVVLSQLNLYMKYIYINF